MSQVRVHQNRNRVRLGSEEEKAWRGFYRDVRNPDVATEIIKELDADAESKRAHLALYMSCKQTQRIDKSRKARNQRIGQFVRWLADKVCMAPWRVIKGWLRGSRDVAVECLPEVRKEPAARQVERLGKDDEFVQAKTNFINQAATPAPAPAPAPAAAPSAAPAAPTAASTPAPAAAAPTPAAAAPTPARPRARATASAPASASANKDSN